jgi:hypothetical protein
VIAEPPSLLGAVHDTSNDELVPPEVLTFVGAPGAPGMVDVALEGLENVPVPAVLTAAIWNS